MSDLSRLLDDVYGDLGTAPATPPAPAPDGDGWAGSDPFASWTDDHGARLAGDDDEPTAAVDDVPAFGAPTSTLLLRDLGPAQAEVTGEVPAAVRTWHRADDDILPEGRVRSGRRRRRSTTTSPAADASIEDFAAEGSAFDALAALDAPPPADDDHPVATDEHGTGESEPAGGRRLRLRRR